VAPVAGGVMGSGGARGGGSGGVYGGGGSAASEPCLCMDQRASCWQWTRGSRRDAGDRQEQKEQLRHGTSEWCSKRAAELGTLGD
jgi:hypothetical protein